MGSAYNTKLNPVNIVKKTGHHIYTKKLKDYNAQNLLFEGELKRYKKIVTLTIIKHKYQIITHKI